MIYFIEKNRNYIKTIFFLFIFIIINSILFADIKNNTKIDISKKEDQIISTLKSSNLSKNKKNFKYIKSNKNERFQNKIVQAILSDTNINNQLILLKALKLFDKKKYLNNWIKILKTSRNIKIKIYIIEEIYSVDNSKIVPIISNLLKSPFYKIRYKSALILKKIGDDRIYPYILTMGRSKNPVYRIYAAEAMFFLYDTRFYDPLILLLNDANKSVRIYILKSLYKNNIKKSLNKIRILITDDPNDEVRIEAIKTVVKFNDKKSFYYLLKVLTNKNKNIRNQVITALQKLSLKKSITSLSNLLYTENNELIKNNIIETMIIFKKIGKIKGIKKILLEDKNVRFKIKAAYLLGLITNKKSQKLLEKGLKSNTKNYRVRAEICHSLGNYKSSSNTLLYVIRNETKRYVRSAALFSIKKLKIKKTLLPLFNQYAIEEDPVFKFMLYNVLNNFIDKFI